mmetsp:Transcript_2582/g.5031  ORF Transcript_2582/g.5031 Transcript_2582/m.5031 type:complete len:463 (-) Transcript_2582:46-1434(-)
MRVENFGIDTSIDSIKRVDFDDLDRVPRKFDFGLVCLFQMVQTALITIVFTTVDTYDSEMGLGSKLWAGVLIGIVPLISGISVLGWQVLNDKVGYSVTLATMGLTGVLGCCLYSAAGAIHSPGVLVLGRVFMGFAGANNVLFHYLAVTVGRNMQTKYVSLLAASGVFGLGLGPLMSGVINSIVEAVGLGVDAPIIFNVLTVPTWIMSIVLALCAVCFLSLFQAPTLSDQARFKQSLIFEKDELTDGPLLTWLNACLAVTLFSVVVLASGNGSTETRTAFIAISNYTNAAQVGTGFAWSWSIVGAGIYVGAVALVFSLFCLIQPLIASCFPALKERHWLLIYCLSGTLSSAFMYSYPISKTGTIVMWTFGMILFNGSLLLCKCVVFSLGMKLCPSKWMGGYTSALGLMNCIGRAIGPVLATYIGNGYLDALMFGLVLSGSMLANTIAVVVVFPHMQLSRKKNE